MDNTEIFTPSFVGIEPPPNRTIPGSLTEKEAVTLSDWCKDRLVLQIGCYCGKGLVVVAKAAKHVWVMDSFLHYPGGLSTIPGEAMASVKAAGEEINAKIDLLSLPDPEMLEAIRGDPAYPEFDTVYVDADWPDQEGAQKWAMDNAKGGIVIYHHNGGISKSVGF